MMSTMNKKGKTRGLFCLPWNAARPTTLGAAAQGGDAEDQYSASGLRVWFSLATQATSVGCVVETTGVSISMA
jgi:hypothetical protein